MLRHVLTEDIINVPQAKGESEHRSPARKECCHSRPLVLWDLGDLFGPLEQVSNPECGCEYQGRKDHLVINRVTIGDARATSS